MVKIIEVLKKSIPHVSAIAIFLVISSLYFAPQLSGFRLYQSDQVQFHGMSKEINDYREKFDDETLWTNSMFGGMPTYQIAARKVNIVKSIEDIFLRLVPRPIGYMFLLMIGFYILMICLSVNPWLAIIGSVAFGLSSFNILYLGAGHNAKVHALAFIPPVLGSVIYAFRKNAVIGSALLSIFLCLHLSANHLQMTYYLLYLLLAVVIVEFIIYRKEKILKRFLRVSLFLLLGGVIGILPIFTNLYITYEYGKYTTRGKSELTISADDSVKDENKKALDKDYIKQYSLGFGEVWSVVIPNVKGGAMGLLRDHKKIMDEVDPRYKQNVASAPSYWGEQLSSGGAFYYGAPVFLLFILGLFLVKDKLKWALLAVSLLAIILSWKYAGITDWFIEHVPLYNKFRDTKMMLVLVQLSFPLLGALFLQKLFREEIRQDQFLYVALGTIGVILLMCLMPNAWFDFLSRNDTAQFSSLLQEHRNDPNTINFINGLKQEIIDARISIFKLDCTRSLIFMLIAAALIYAYIIQKIQREAFLILLGLLITIDLWGVNRRYLDNNKTGRNNYDHWVEAYRYSNPLNATEADKEILRIEMEKNPALAAKIDSAVKSINITGRRVQEMKTTEEEKASFKELNFATDYRVLELNNPFSNARTSYFHKSIGGYHGAKLKKYQELIEFHISPEYAKIIDVFRGPADPLKLDLTLRTQIPVLNMLNTRYIIYNETKEPIVNNHAHGNAWFVNNIIWVENANEEILSLKDIDENTAVIRKKYQDEVPENLQPDSLANINLVSYKPNHLVYKSSSKTEQLAVFSEIYYDAGWKVFVDGEETVHFPVNYLLRGMTVPPGEHTITFKFEPKSYYLGRNLSIAGSVLIVLYVVGSLVWNRRRRGIGNR